MSAVLHKITTKPVKLEGCWEEVGREARKMTAFPLSKARSQQRVFCFCFSYFCNTGNSRALCMLGKRPAVSHTPIPSRRL